MVVVLYLIVCYTWVILFYFFNSQFCIDLLTGTFYMNVFVFFYNEHVIWWSLPLCEGEENNVTFKLAHFYFTRLLQ